MFDVSHANSISQWHLPIHQGADNHDFSTVTKCICRIRFAKTTERRRSHFGDEVRSTLSLRENIKITIFVLVFYGQKTEKFRLIFWLFKSETDFRFFNIWNDWLLLNFGNISHYCLYLLCSAHPLVMSLRIPSPPLIVTKRPFVPNLLPRPFVSEPPPRPFSRSCLFVYLQCQW